MKKYISGIDIINYLVDGKDLPLEIYNNRGVKYTLRKDYIERNRYSICINYIYKENCYENLSLNFTPNLQELYYYYDTILDDTEKRYLSKIIKPFKDRVRYIRKTQCGGVGYYIQIMFIEIDATPNFIDLPTFKGNTMYKNMKLDIQYTLDELDI